MKPQVRRTFETKSLKATAAMLCVAVCLGMAGSLFAFFMPVPWRLADKIWLSNWVTAAGALTLICVAGYCVVHLPLALGQRQWAWAGLNFAPLFILILSWTLIHSTKNPVTEPKMAYMEWWRKHRKVWEQELRSVETGNGDSVPVSSQARGTTFDNVFWPNEEDGMKSATFMVRLASVDNYDGFVYAPGSNKLEDWMAVPKVIYAEPLTDGWYFVRGS